MSQQTRELTRLVRDLQYAAIRAAGTYGDTKSCSRCLTNKPLQEFSIMQGRYLVAQCNSCNAIRQARKRQADPAKHQAELQRWRESNKDYLREVERARKPTPGRTAASRRANARRVTTLSDSYVKQQLGLSAPPPLLIAAKRLQLQLTRLAREGIR